MADTRALLRKAALLLICASCSGAELILNDLRLAWSYQPTDFEYSLHDKNILGSTDATYAGDDAFATAWSLEWRALRHWAGPGRSGGPVAGLGALGTWYSYEDGGSLQILSAEALGGYAQAFGERWTLHALASAGLGYGLLELDNPSASSDLAFDGLVWDVGAELGASYRIAHRWRLLGAVGWRQRQGDLSGDGFELDLENSGFSFTIGVGFILSPEPRRIE